MEKLLASITDEERELLLSQLDLERAVEQDKGLSAKQRQRRDHVWTTFHETAGATAMIARPASVKSDPSVVARLAAYEFFETERGSGLFSGWLLSGYLSQLDSGELVLRQLAIEPEHEGQVGITRDLLERLSPSRLIAKVRAYLSALPEAVTVDEELGRVTLNDEERTAVDDGAELAGDPVRPRLARRYEEVAVLCLNEQRAGTRGVLERVRQEMSQRLGRDVPMDTLRSWIRQARRPPHEFLAAGERGRLAFAPGPGLRGRWRPPSARVAQRA